MTKKELRLLELLMEKVVRRVLNEDLMCEADEEYILPIAVIDKIEDFLGEPISFMGIS